MTISVNSLPVISPIGNTSTICLGQSTTLSVSGAASYLWSTGSSSSSITVNPTSNATYSITGTGVNGCIKTETFTVQVNSLPTITISGNSTICNGTSTTLNASGATSYTWSTGSNLNQITVNPSSNTSYTVTGTDSNSCSNTKVHDRPSKEELEKMINTMSWCAIGRKYGVSDNAVRKWAKKLNLI